MEDIRQAIKKLMQEQGITLDQLSCAVGELEKQNNILCQSVGDEPLTLHDIDANLIGGNALSGIEDYSIVDYDNNGYTLDKVHIDNEKKELAFEFVDNPKYKKSATAIAQK